MKFTTTHLYITIAALGIGILAFVVISGNNSVIKPVSEADKTMPQDEIHRSAQAQRDKGEMPNDEIHKGMGSMGKDAPSKANVSQHFWDMMDSLKKSVEKNPNDTASMKQYADFLLMAHKPDEALPLYEKIVQKDKKRFDIMFSLASIYHGKNDFAKAEALMNTILSIDKDNALAMYNLGALAASQGNNDKAKSMWENLLKKTSTGETADLARQSLKELNQGK